MTFFPHLLAGPIIHHSEMMPQFQSTANKRVDWRNVAAGLFLLSIGLAKKVFLADPLVPLVSAGFDHATTIGTLQAWLSALAYTLQIYFDFSGYTDMALGAALIFNIRLPINFDSPYRSLDLRAFWHRWHMTLSRFLREYVYVPLGGNRAAETRVLANLLLTFLLGGLWHGAAWTFVCWGALHGLGLCAVRLWRRTGRTLPRAGGLGRHVPVRRRDVGVLSRALARRRVGNRAGDGGLIVVSGLGERPCTRRAATRPQRPRWQRGCSSCSSAAIRMHSYGRSQARG